MIGNYFARLTGSKRNLLALLASSVVLTAGCANMSTMAPTGTNPFVSPATLGGKVHGGNQPVIGATVTLWYAGQIGSPSFLPTLAATTTTDSTGSFAFTKDPALGNPADDGTISTYSCPSGTDPLVYVMSKGGNTQNNGTVGQTNTAAAFIAIYDVCSALSGANFVYMSEVTTVATMAAVTQFFNPANDTLNADGTGQQKLIVDGLSRTVALLANPTTGLYVPQTVIPAVAGGDIASTVNLTAIPEPGKVNLLANIISACVNGATSSAPACTTLFNAALPPAANTTSLNGAPFPTATDTLQALFYMFTNPTDGQGATGTTNLATIFGLAGGIGAPYQPSAAQPTDWTIAISYNSSSNCGTGTSSFIQGPVDVNIDAQNNVWIANSVGGNLSAISAAGAPLACVNMSTGTSNAGGTVDLAYNIWYGADTTMFRYNPTTKTTLAFPAPAGVSPLAITADGVGNVYFTGVAGTTGSLYIIPGASSAAAAVPAVQISNTLGPNPIRLMPDATSATPKTVPGNIWVSSGSTFVSQVSKSTAAGNLNGWITTPFTTSGNSYGLSIGRGNNVFTSGIDNNAITELAFTAPSTWATASGFPFTAATAGISSPSGISIDGRQSTWIPNVAQNSISEISFFGPNPLSQSSGFQKSSGFLNGSGALAIDQAGNVWIVGSANNFVTEIVGAAVPLYTPYSVGVNNGRFQSIP